jgi:ATP-dependent Clp protease ATP-binding subunit ClpA
MFERFTDRSRRVLVLAQEEARGLGHGFIGTEHILLGLIVEADGVAAKALGGMGATLDVVRDRVIAVHRPNVKRPPGSAPFTDRAKKILEYSLREALELGHSYIGTEHLVLGLARVDDGMAVQVLRDLGIEISEVRARVFEMMSGHSGWELAEPLQNVDPDTFTLRRLVQAFGEQLRPDLQYTDLDHRAAQITDKLIELLRNSWADPDNQAGTY